MTDLPKGSTAEQDAKGAKVFAMIAMGVFVALHIGVFFMSSTPMQNIKATPALWAIPIAAVIWLGVCVYAVMKDAFWVTEAKWPYIVLILLAAASVVAIGYTPAGLTG